MKCIALGVFVSVLAVSMGAQNEVKPVWTGKLGASYIASAGNTNNSTIGASGEASWLVGHFAFSTKNEFLRTTTESEPSAHRVNVVLTAERVIEEKIGFFAEGSYFEDPPAGTESQFSMSAGAVKHIMRDKRRVLDASLSLTHVREQRTVAPHRNFVGVQVGVELRREQNEFLSTEHAASYVHDFVDTRNWRLRATSSLIVALNQRLALKFSSDIYRNKPDAGGSSIDRTMMASLVMRWPPKE